MKWQSIINDPPPMREFILIKTVNGLVRVARRFKAMNGEEYYHYASVTYKNVTEWQPLPK